MNKGKIEMWVDKSYSNTWNSRHELNLSNHSLIPKYLTMPKPLVKHSREKISKEFFVQRIKEIGILIQKRREVRLFLTFCIWLQTGCPENLEQLSDSLNSNEDSSHKVSIKEIGQYMDLVNEKINWQNIPTNILEFYNGHKTKINDYTSAQYIRINNYMANLLIQILFQIKNPIEKTWDFLEDIFKIPRPDIDCNCNSKSKIVLWSFGRFENLSQGSVIVIKSIYNMFGYFSTTFSGIHEHFFHMAATLFWCTRTESVYSLELYELLKEMFGEHKLHSRSSQLCDKCTSSELVNCEKKVGSKNRSSIYFILSPGAEWIIANLFPDEKLLMQQQAIAISFLRYSKRILTSPWTINPINFDYLMDVWFKSFLYSDNLDQIVYEKARELRRNIFF